MTNLSWFLYFADISNSLQVLALIGAIGVFFAIFCVFVCATNETTFEFKRYASLAYIGIGFSLACVLLPSKTTIYAIAASEVAEKAIESKTGDKVLKAIELWIDDQIDKAGKK